MRKRFSAGLFILVLAASPLFAQTDTWAEDYDAALAKAAKENKYLLMNFSGSDWCIWCKRLNNEVFSKDVFREWAEDNLVLLLVDSPRARQMDEEIVEQNNRLKKEYAIRGFPTIILLNPEGEVAAQTGYQYGGAEKYIEHLKELIAKDKKRS